MILSEEVGSLILFLADDDSGAITNQSYVVNGDWLDSVHVRAALTRCRGSWFRLRRCEDGQCDRLPVWKLDNKREAAAHLFDRPSQCREVHIGAFLGGPSPKLLRRLSPVRLILEGAGVTFSIYH
jgi:hypothetical protein